MSRTKNRTAMSTAVIGQKGSFLLKQMKTTICIMTGHSNQEKIEKRSSQGQHRIARTGYPGQDNRTARVDRMFS